MKKQQFSGKTLEEALLAASLALSVPTSEIKYENLTGSSSGLLNKLFSRNIKIDAWVESKTNSSKSDIDLLSDARKAAKQGVLEASGKNRSKAHLDQVAYENKPLANSEAYENKPLVTLETPGVRELLQNFASKFNTAFQGAAEPTLKQEDADTIVVNLDNSVIQEILGKSDKISAAFEHLFKRLLQKNFGDMSTRIVLEVGDAAEVRRLHLEQIAIECADKVRETGKTVSLFAKSNQERRIIHLALENKEGIATKSIGMGDKRKLIIFATNSEKSEQLKKQPKKKGPRVGGAPAANVVASTAHEPSQLKPEMPSPEKKPRGAHKGVRSEGRYVSVRREGTHGGVRREGTDFGNMPSRQKTYFNNKPKSSTEES
jgi:spoIIIJ-associated protein